MEISGVSLDNRREMGSIERDQTTQHHPLHISSLVVRPSGSNDREDNRDAATGDDPRDRPSFARSDRHKGHKGHSRIRANSTSPRRPYGDHRHSSDFNHSTAPPRGREFSSRRESSGRYRDYSPPNARGGAGARRFDGPESAHGKSDGMGRNNNNPKVQPRDGDWYCQDPSCRNLNFARRECCYKCKRDRYAPANSPPPPRRLPPPMNLSPRRDFNGYRSPPRGYPRDYPPPRHDHPTWRDREGDRLRYSDIEYPPSRRIASDWVHHEPLPKPHYERRPPLSPPPPPPPPRGGRWGRHSRERSRSPPLRDGRLQLRDGPPPQLRDDPPPQQRDGPPPPMRGRLPPLREFRRDSYFERGGQDGLRGGRDRM